MRHIDTGEPEKVQRCAGCSSGRSTKTAKAQIPQPLMRRSSLGSSSWPGATGPVQWNETTFVARTENTQCLKDWNELENLVDETQRFPLRLLEEPHRMDARMSPCGVVRPRYCEHVSSISWVRRVSGSRRVVLCDTPGWPALSLRIRVIGFEAPDSDGPACDAGDASSQPPSCAGLVRSRKRQGLVSIPIRTYRLVSC
jgi:hypothetical protein